MVVFPIFLFLLFYTNPSLTSKFATVHNCQVEPYTETINLQNCSKNMANVHTTRCRGQCYSEDILIYDWQNAPTHYRHKRKIGCCSPIQHEIQEIRLMCENEPRTIKYRVITQCECRSCSDRCIE